MAARVTGDTSDDTHLADDSKRGENAAGSSGYAPKAAPDWKPGYFRAIAQKRAGDGSAASTVEQAGIGNSESAAFANSLNSADTHRADTHRERRIARNGKAYTWPEFLEYYLRLESVAANSWNSADIHRAGDGSASSTVSECETAIAVATEAQFRDDHTLYVYDRTTFTNPYITDDLLNEPGYFLHLARKRAMCVFDDAGDGSAGSTVEQAGIGNSEPAASANSLNSADTHRADTHRERRIARTVEQTGNEDEDPGETCSRLCSGVPPPAASRSVSSSALINEDEDPRMCSGVPPPAASRSVSSSASDSEEEWRRQHPEPFEGAKDAAEKLRRIKHERNYQRHRSASTLCKHLNRRGGCRHGCTPTKTYCHKYQRGQCDRGRNCRYAHS